GSGLPKPLFCFWAKIWAKKGVSSMWLVVGLGNPGGEYKLTRHNIGFMAVDFLLKGLGSPSAKNHFKAEVTQVSWHDHQILFCKPQTYMNLSGESVQALMG